MFVGVFVTIQVQSPSPKSKSKVQVKSPIPKSKSKSRVQFKNPSLKSKLYTKSWTWSDSILLCHQNSIQDCDKVESNSSSFYFCGERCKLWQSKFNKVGIY